MTNYAAARNKSHLVFLHGGGVGPWMWRQQRHYFGHHFVVHTPTLPGHEPGSAAPYTTHRDAVRSVARQIGLDNLSGCVTVVGFSVGGQVAMEFAAMFPERVEKTVVVSSLVAPWRSARLLAWASGLAAPLARRERFARAQAKELQIPDEDFESYLLLSRSIARETLVNVLRTDLSYRPPAGFLVSPRPVLLIAGSTEQRALVDGLARLSRGLPSAEFVLIEGAGHGAPFAQPEEFNGLLDARLRREGPLPGK